MNYLIYLNDKSIIQASTSERPYDILVGEIECDAEDLEILLNITQNSVDACIIQLADKANNLFNNKNNQDLN
jgi:hypothetical protein